MSDLLLLVALLVAPVSLFLGLFAIAYAVPRYRRYKNAAGPPRASIATCDPGLASVAGRVRPEREGLLECPVSGEPAVYVAVTVRYAWVHKRTDQVHWADGITATAAVPFLVEDESGATARVGTEGTRFDLEAGHIPVSHRKERPVVDNTYAFMQERSHPDTWRQFEQKLDKRTSREVSSGLRYHEERIGPDDEVFVIGPAQVREGTAAAYRSGQEARVRFTGDSAQPVLVTVTDPATQMRSWRQAIGCGVAGVAFALLVGIGLFIYLYR